MAHRTGINPVHLPSSNSSTSIRQSQRRNTISVATSHQQSTGPPNLSPAAAATAQVTNAGLSTLVQYSTGFPSTPEDMSTWQGRSRGSKTPDLVDGTASSTKPEHTEPAATHAGQAKPNLTAQVERQESTPVARRSRPRRRARGGTSPGRTKTDETQPPTKRRPRENAPELRPPPTMKPAGQSSTRMKTYSRATPPSPPEPEPRTTPAGAQPDRAHESEHTQAADLEPPPWTRPRSTRSTPSRGRLRHPRRLSGAKCDAEEPAATAKA